MTKYFFGESKFLVFPHFAVVTFWQKFRENNCYELLDKWVDFTKYFFGESKFLVFYTVWKYQNFSATQILREINLWECRSSKSSHYAHYVIFWGTEVIFPWYFAIFEGCKLPETKFRTSEITKMPVFQLPYSSNWFDVKSE